VQNESPPVDTFGDKDSSYLAAGKLEGIQQLVSCFYNIMSELLEAAHIRAMHPANLTVSIDKLACFLSGWLGGRDSMLINTALSVFRRFTCI
jgi:hemoglobin